MKIWILRPVDDLPDDDNPWEPWYDKCFGFIVSAPDEATARQVAQDNGKDEKRGEFLGKQVSLTTTPWCDSKYSTCEILKATKVGCIMEDVQWA